MANLEVGDIVLCTVERIEKTIVFVKIEDENKDLEGSIIMSEVAPGRIRNIRNYVVPKKKIVCKVLRISGNRIDLSLRRVTKKEKEEILEHYKQEKSYMNILKSIMKDKTKEIIKEIQKKEKIYDFFEEAKKNPEKLEKIIGKENAKKILEILKTQKQKKAIIKKEFSLKTTQPDGIKLIKKILEIKDAEIKYISAGNYSIKTESEDIKKADKKLQSILKEISEKAKKNKVEFKIKEK
ncbi:hypothetical protein DRN73_04615 [Candidatus Pacearchaeota archaeon]|nr:MAG: hypothetical protein DRN73_04615 [Candidatus Pacearchaeota archaeon]